MCPADTQLRAPLGYFNFLITTHLPFSFFNATFSPAGWTAMLWATEAVTCSPVVRVTVTPENSLFAIATPVTVPVCVAEGDGVVVDGVVVDGVLVEGVLVEEEEPQPATTITAASPTNAA